MITPFSGLSLIIHLVVIGFATLSRALFKRKGGGKATGKIERTKTRRTLTYMFSVCIIIVVSSFMIVSFMIAIKTGIREGADEPHIVYVREELENVAGVQKVNADAIKLNDQ